MPLTDAVMSEEVFHYTGRDDYDNFYAYLARRMYYMTPSDCVLHSDGSIRYYSGSGLYSTLYPGDWITSRGVLNEEQFRTLGYAWSSEEPSS